MIIVDVSMHDADDDDGDDDDNWCLYAWCT